MRAHRRRSAGAVAAQDRGHDPVVLDVRFGEPAEIAELGAAERLHPRPGRESDLGQIGVVGARIDRAVKRSLTS